MDAGNESQRLKRAVATLITLTVILAISLCFLYSAYASAVDAASKARTGQIAALEHYERLRLKIGARAQDCGQVSEEISAHFKKVDERLDALLEQVNAAVLNVQANGAQGPELEETKQNAQRVVASLRSEPHKTYISSLDRFVELMQNLSFQTTQISFNYMSVRHALESATRIAKMQVDLQSKAATDSHAELLDEHMKHDEERAILLIKIDQLQTALDKAQIELLNFARRVNEAEDQMKIEPRGARAKSATSKSATSKKE
jgi:hypothetical protein